MPLTLVAIVINVPLHWCLVNISLVFLAKLCKSKHLSWISTGNSVGQCVGDMLRKSNQFAAIGCQRACSFSAFFPATPPNLIWKTQCFLWASKFIQRKAEQPGPL